MIRVLALLDPYFAKDIPQEVREVQAEDWMDALGGFPYWAIERACRWWAGPDRSEKERHTRPVHGDIADRVKVEMGVVDVARLAVSRFGKGSMFYVEKHPPPVDAGAAEARRKAAAEIIAKAGLDLSSKEIQTATRSHE